MRAHSELGAGTVLSVCRMRLDVLTLFPEMFPGYMGQSVLSAAIERGLVDIRLHNIRDWAKGRHQVVDDRPFGGGPGMVLKVEPVVECVEAVQAQADPGHLVMLTPQGRKLNQQIVEELAGKQRLLLLCGRYEGFDDRVRQILQPDEVSIGDYVLSGGELAAMVIVDTVVRLAPGVLGHEESNKQDSFSGEQRLLEFGQFTRPRVYRGLEVPEILLSGNHEQIAQWRHEQSLVKTRERRDDLLTSNNLETQTNQSAGPAAGTTQRERKTNNEPTNPGLGGKEQS